MPRAGDEPLGAGNLLRGPQGERLRAIATRGDQSHRTAKAMAWLRANYTKPLRVEELAEVARMGMSTLVVSPCASA